MRTIAADTVGGAGARAAPPTTISIIIVIQMAGWLADVNWG